MTNFSTSDRVALGTVQLAVRYELYGDAECALARNSATIDAVVCQGFAELWALGACFGVPYHYFEIDFEKETLHFALSCDAYQPGEDLVIAISLVEACPFEVEISDLPEAARNLLRLMTDNDTSDPTKSG